MNINNEFKDILIKLKDHPSSLIKAEYLKRIEKKNINDPDIKKLQQKALLEDPLKAILANRNEEGWWYNSFPAAIYKKYQGTSWNLLFLAEFGALPSHPQIRESCEYFLDHCYVEKTGAFESQGRPSAAMACFTAHACLYLTYFGFLKDERVQNAYKWLSNRFGKGDGMTCPAQDIMLNPTCTMAITKFLKAAVILSKKDQERLLGSSLKKAINKMIKIKIDHYVPIEVTDWYKAIPGKKIAKIRKLKSKWKFSGKYKSKPSWSRFQFPLHYDSDLLDILLALGRLEVKNNPAIKNAAQRIYNLKENNRTWKARRTLNGKMWVDLKYQDDWITLRALEVLRYYL